MPFGGKRVDVRVVLVADVHLERIPRGSTTGAIGLSLGERQTDAF